MTSEDTSARAQDGRRRFLYAGVGAVAAIAGASVALWRHGQQSAGPLDPALWTMNFDAPGGGVVALQALKGKPLVLNFWATWCPPCVEEMPLLDAFFRQNAANRWQVLGLAIDQPSAVRTFLQKTPVSYAIGLAGLGGTELAKSLGNETGGLPFTLVIDSAGRIVQRKMGRVTPADLTAWPTLG